MPSTAALAAAACSTAQYRSAAASTSPWACNRRTRKTKPCCWRSTAAQVRCLAAGALHRARVTVLPQALQTRRRVSCRRALRRWVNKRDWHSCDCCVTHVALCRLLRPFPTLGTRLASLAWTICNATARDRSHHASRATRHSSHVTRHTSHVTRHSTHHAPSPVRRHVALLSVGGAARHRRGNPHPASAPRAAPASGGCAAGAEQHGAGARHVLLVLAAACVGCCLCWLLLVLAVACVGCATCG